MRVKRWVLVRVKRWVLVREGRSGRHRDGHLFLFLLEAQMQYRLHKRGSLCSLVTGGAKVETAVVV